MGGNVGGMTSSIVFDQNRGMELFNPDFVKSVQSKKPDNYFNKESGFKTVIEAKQSGNSIFQLPKPKN